MSQSIPQQEPTMEEILASIRKIISEDSTESAQPQAEAQPATAHELQETKVLELTQEARDEPSPAPLPVSNIVEAAAPPAQPDPAPHVPTPQSVQHDRAVHDMDALPIEEMPMQNATPAAAPSDDGIFSEKTRKALNDAFTNLEPASEPKPAPGPPASVAPVDGRMLEAVFDHAVRETFDPVLHNWLEQNKDIVVERMKPVVTQWLDEHFPAMLDEAVREEIARVAKSRVRR